MADEFLLTMEGISKSFPGVQALDDVHLQVRPGTVHALMGENGAGKSTLMKVLIGMYHPDAGTITFEGNEVTIADTATALKLGISMIHQELSPVPEMTIAENIWLGREPLRFGLIDYRKMQADTAALFKRFEIDLNPRSVLKKLSVAQTQMVEIAKAISYDSRLVIMDEPTSAITEREVAHLHRIIRALKAEGVGVIYITHKMDEVFKISDYVTVFRDGRHVASLPAAELDKNKLIMLMVGRELTQLFPKEHAPIGDVLMSVQGLTRQDGAIQDVSFDIHRGEILGLAGLMGAGRTETLEAIFGVAKLSAGTVTVNGKVRKVRHSRDAIKAGIGLLTEDRKQTGIMGVLSVRDNMSVASMGRYSRFGFLRGRAIDREVQRQREALSIKTPTIAQLIKLLSGGNQQKVLVSRWLMTLPDVLMIDEPTRGIDVGAKVEIHRLMTSLAKEGKAILMVSSEMPEVLGMSDRVLVMSGGRITGEFSRAEATQEKILAAATGVDQAA